MKGLKFEEPRLIEPLTKASLFGPLPNPGAEFLTVYSFTCDCLRSLIL